MADDASREHASEAGEVQGKPRPLSGSHHRDAGPGQEAVEASKHDAPAGVQSLETEDAYLQGGSSKEQTQLLKKNVQEHGQAEEHPNTPGGLHATGSKTGKP